VFSGQKHKKAPRENPPNGDFFVFSHGDFSPRHTEVRHIPCVAFSATVCRFFAKRGKRSVVVVILVVNLDFCSIYTILCYILYFQFNAILRSNIKKAYRNKIMWEMMLKL